MGLALRLFRLGAQSLWVDEVFTWGAAAIHHPLALRDWLENIHGPLYGAIVHAWGSVAGDSEWALRFPSAVLGALGVPAIAWLAARWIGPDTAVPAAWLAAGSPFLVWYGQEARNYALLVTLAALAGALLLGRTLRERGMWILTAAAGLLTNFSFALLLPLHARWALAGRRLRAVHVLLALAALAALAAPWLPQALQQLDFRRLSSGAPGAAPLRASGNVSAAALPFALHAFAVGYTLGPSLRELRAGAPAAVRAHAGELAITAIVFGLIGGAGLIALARRRRLLDLLLWMVPPAALITWFALRNFKVFHPRYLAVSFPAFVVVLAAGLVALPRPWRRAAALLVAGVWAVSLAQHYFDPRYGKDDVRSAVRLVDAHAAPNEVLVAANTEDLLAYYHRGPQPVRRVWLGWARDSIRLERRVRETLDGSPGAWVILARPEDLDPHGAFARLLDARWPAASTWRFEGVRVWHLVPRVARPDSTGARTHRLSPGIRTRSQPEVHA